MSQQRAYLREDLGQSINQLQIKEPLFVGLNMADNTLQIVVELYIEILL